MILLVYCKYWDTPSTFLRAVVLPRFLNDRLGRPPLSYAIDDCRHLRLTAVAVGLGSILAAH